MTLVGERPGRGLGWLLALAIAASCGGVSRPAPGPSLLGSRLPALDGGEIGLATPGRAVVLHCFTTWSLASQLDIEQLLQAHQDADVEVIGIALDVDGHKLVAPWRDATRVPYPIALATDAIRRGQSSLGAVRQVPTTLLLDRRGRIAHRIVGPLEVGELARVLDQLR